MVDGKDDGVGFEFFVVFGVVWFVVFVEFYDFDGEVVVDVSDGV